MKKKYYVLGLQPRYFLRRQNTDWRHNQFLESALSGHDRMLFKLRTSLRATIDINLQHLTNSLRGRLWPNVHTKLSIQDVSLYSSDLNDAPDAIYSYGLYPRNSRAPVIWHNAHTDVELLLSRGVSDSSISQELLWKANCARRAAIVALSSEYGKFQFDTQFPDYAGKTVVLPFLLPNVRHVSSDEIMKKHSAVGVKILFVGRQAKRKGLDLVLSAYQRVRQEVKCEISLRIISSLDDGHIDIPRQPDITWQSNLSHDLVQQEMQDAHILAMPSREETFGLVYLEAMAAGAVSIAPNRQPQISLMENGRLGYLCACTEESVFDTLKLAICRQDERLTKALLAANSYVASHSYEMELSKYLRTFESVLR